MAEYFDRQELQAMTGQPFMRFAAVAMKELIDNALDACEATGAAPELRVDVVARNGELRFAVSDNGAGIDPDVVARILDFNTRPSDKALYRTPTRGAQGNALKTVVGMPFALWSGNAPPVVIRSKGVNHYIRVKEGAGGVPRIEHERSLGSEIACGAGVAISLPEWQDFDPEHLTRAFALFNPHANVSFSFSGASHHGESAVVEIAETHIATNPGYSKFMPTDPLVVHWFDEKTFERFVLSLVEAGRDDYLGQFLMNTFRGFKASHKAKEAASAVPQIRRLSDFEKRPQDLGLLFRRMRQTVKEPTHKVLGSPVGEVHLTATLASFYGGVDRYWYKRVNTTLNGAPAIVEVVVAETEEPGGLFYGVNHSPTFDDPLASAGLFAKGGPYGYGIAGFLENAHAYRDGGSTSAAVHFIAAAPTFLDRGKTRLDVQIGSELRTAITHALWAASKTLDKDAKKRERDAAAAQRDADRRARQRGRRIPQLAACFEVMEEAYAYSTGNGALPTSVRDLYYAVRNRIERFGYDADELDQNYFSQTILTRYRQEQRDLPDVFYEPRGVLYEPHDGGEIRLGTKSVAEYSFPEYAFDKILYIEKRGRVEILRAARLDDAYDMAIVGGEGYATEAIRNLFANAEEGDYQLFVLHDADPHGYNIARTLAEETARMPGYSVAVIDIGLKLEDALQMGKNPETFTRRNQLPATLEAELTDVEREHFVGEERVDRNGKKYWIAKRVELNDLSSPQLVAYVEEKLEENGVRGKVIPPDDVLADLVEEKYRALSAEWALAAIDRIICAPEFKREVADEFRDRFHLEGARSHIEEAFAKNRTLSWREAVEARLQAVHGEHDAALMASVEQKLRGRLAK